MATKNVRRLTWMRTLARGSTWAIVYNGVWLAAWFAVLSASEDVLPSNHRMADKRKLTLPKDPLTVLASRAL